MSHFGSLALIVIVVALAIPLLQFVAMTVQVLRLRIYPARWLPLAPRPKLAPDQEAAMTELFALGFAENSWFTCQQGPFRHLCIALTHANLPAMAILTLQPIAYCAYRVSFCSLGAGGELLLTSNRASWARFAEASRVRSEDAYAGDLKAHWQVHRTRIEAATCVSDAAQILQAVVAESQESFAAACASGDVVVTGEHWHPSLRAALRVAGAWMRARRKLGRPYASAAITGEHQPEYFTRCYEELETVRAHMPIQRNVRAWLLALSLGLSVLLWGWYVGWGQALALVAILLAHESGHALAMRYFGYRDLTMFFLPFFGALITGEPREIAAWKQIAILLAGPVPGLVAGAAALVWLLLHPEFAPNFDLQTPAVMAILINMFNLLPITPLDGGQVLDVALFNRWPRARMVFVLASIAAFFTLAIWLAAPAAWLIALFLAFTLRGQWRIARLQLAWPPHADSQQQLITLFDAARKLFGVQSFLRQYGAVRTVMMSRRIRMPRLWETALALLAVLPLWVLVGLAGWEAFSPNDASSKSVELRSPAELAFDELWSADDETAGTLPRLTKLAAELAPDDARRIDLDVRRAESADPAQRDTAYLAIIGGGRDGHYVTRVALAQDWLSFRYEELRLRPALERAAMLEKATREVAALLPDAFEATLYAELRIAEAIDQSGEAALALQHLRALRAGARQHPECRCEGASILPAEVWYHLGHHDAAAALALADDGLKRPENPEDPMDTRSLKLLRAWALIATERSEEGLLQMQSAAYYRPKVSGSWLNWVNATQRPLLAAPADLAYALHRAGRPEDARQLLATRARWLCQQNRAGTDADYSAPFAQPRATALQQMAEALCPSPTSRP